MALTIDIIKGELQKRGLPEANAQNLTFEDEAQMNTFLDVLVKPKVYKTYDDILADDNLKSLALQYGDKRVGAAKIKWEADKPGNEIPKPEDMASLITKAVEAALKPMTEKVTKMETEKQKEARMLKIKILIAKELPEQVHDLVIKAISDDMDDAQITTFIGEQKAKLTEAGLKNIGVPGSGGSGGGDSAKESIKKWGDKKAAKAKVNLEIKKVK